MAFFEQAITVLQTLVIALGAGLGIWGVINLLEGYGNDNPGAKSQGMKQDMARGGFDSLRFYGNLRQICNFSTGRYGHRPLQGLGESALPCKF